MKAVVILVLAVVAYSSVDSKLTCISKVSHDKALVKTMGDDCAAALKGQVQEELKAAMTYMAMGAHFSQDTVNLPGFAKFFFESASEERQHAIKIIEYLLMRLELTDDFSSLISDPKPLAVSWSDGLDALRSALKLEVDVTKMIRNIIAVCEREIPESKRDQVHLSNDYHLVDYLSGDFLTEQYEGQRDLAGKISTLAKMNNSHGSLGQFLFDKKLLFGEV